MQMAKAKDDLVMPLLHRLGEDLGRMQEEIREIKRRVSRLETRCGVSAPTEG